jgi:pimeloyl-ACP methyl ester carboxylesterase
MRRRTVLGTIAAVAGAAVARTTGHARQDAGATATTEGTSVTETATTTEKTGYAPVNGLDMFYEIHGDDAAGGQADAPPLVLLHGAYGMGGMFAAFVPGLAATRRVIVPDLQAHGRTADIDRPIRYETMADDVAALLDHLGVEQADVFGYSMGGGIASRLAMQHPDRVRKLVVAGASFTSGGMYPELLAMIDLQTPEMFAEAPFYAEYREIAPDPDAFPALVEKVKELIGRPYAWPEDEVRAIPAPTLLIYGDADVILPEHMIELFRLRGGGVAGDLVGLPPAQLAILPGTTHVGVMERAAWLLPMVEEFLAAPIPAAARG